MYGDPVTRASAYRLPEEVSFCDGAGVLIWMRGNVLPLLTELGHGVPTLGGATPKGTTDEPERRKDDLISKRVGSVPTCREEVELHPFFSCLASDLVLEHT